MRLQSFKKVVLLSIGFASLQMTSSVALAASVAPAAPSAVVALASSANQIDLKWQDNSSSELGFIVQRSLSSGSGFVQVTSVGAGVVTFANSGLTPSTTYYFRVLAYNKQRGKLVYSAPSAVASSTTLAASATPTPTPVSSPTPTPTPATPTPTPTPVATPTPTPAPVGTLVYPADGLYTRVTIPTLAKPALLSPVLDPTFGTKITRITSNIPHSYAKVQAWNSNQTLIGIGGDSRTILDGKTYQPLRTLPWVASEVKWSHVDPNKMFGINGNRFVSINATTGAATVLHTFTGYTNIYMGPWEGNLSKDDKYVVFITSLGTAADIIVYDIANDIVIAQKSLSSMGYTGSLQPIDWASVSQSGNYIVIIGGGWQTSQNTVKSYDRNLNPVATVFAVGEHGDLGFDSFGNEVFVQVGVSGGPAWMSRLDNGQKTAVLDTGLGNSGHLSCRNVNRPGWCYLTLSQTAEVLAVKLDGSRTVERFVHPRSSGATYEASPTAVASPDGARVMFRSDWYGTSTVDAYVVGMP